MADPAHDEALQETPPDHLAAPQDIYVLPGEQHLVREAAILRTVLGSCVGITFRDPRLGLAGLCHPMLPAYPKRGLAGIDAGTVNVAEARRYVDYTVRELARRFDALGARRNEVEVKVFGGGDVLLLTEPGDKPTVGAMNCTAALRVLAEEGFTILASSLGGTCGVKLQFHTATGEVLLKRLSVAGRPCTDEQSRGRSRA